MLTMEIYFAGSQWQVETHMSASLKLFVKDFSIRLPSTTHSFYSYSNTTVYFSHWYSGPMCNRFFENNQCEHYFLNLVFPPLLFLHVQRWQILPRTISAAWSAGSSSTPCPCSPRPTACYTPAAANPTFPQRIVLERTEKQGRNLPVQPVLFLTSSASASLDRLCLPGVPVVATGEGNCRLERSRFWLRCGSANNYASGP